MRIVKLYALLMGLMLVPLCTLAGWEVSNSEIGVPVTPREPFFQSKVEQPIAAQPYHTAMPPRQMALKPYHRLPPYRMPPYHPLMSTAITPLPRLANPSRSLYAVSISGSVKENMERIMSRYHWRVIWKAPYDYNFDGRIVGSSLPNVIEKLLQPFPLQAVMYMSNRTMAVSSRPRYKV